MICPSCGFLNQQQRLTCLKCGKSLAVPGDAGGSQGKSQPRSPGPQSDTGRSSESPERQGGVSPEEIVNKMRLDYSFSHGDPTQKAIDGMLALISESLKGKCDLGKLTVDAANMIQRQFGVREVAIGLRSPQDGLYRYKVMVGIRGDAERAMRLCVYQRSEFGDSPKYRGSVISKFTKVYLAENMPFTDEERATYSRPILLDSPRKNWMESLEADYLNTTIHGRDGDFIGWIEISGLRTGILPDANTIRWVELIGQIIGAALAAQGKKAQLPDISLPGVDR